MTYLTVVGPTCAGKTRFTRPLIEHQGFVPINMDSFQLYSFFRLGTGRGDRVQKEGYLYGVVDPHQELSESLYLDLVEEALESIVSRGLQPMFEGGSLTLLRMLSSKYRLQLVGVLPDPKMSVDELVINRINAMGRQKLINETREGLSRGYRNTWVLQDEVIYLPLVQYLDGERTESETFDRIRVNWVKMHQRQMAAYAGMDIEWR